MTIGFNRITGLHVAIKAIDKETCERKESFGSIQEVDAMMLLHKSSHVVKLIDHFEIDDETYIVTKYAKGGDLLNYCSKTKESSGWLSENRARHIFI